jgi:hypothetical protein
VFGESPLDSGKNGFYFSDKRSIIQEFLEIFIFNGINSSFQGIPIPIPESILGK